jgi:hypothetical protein
MIAGVPAVIRTGHVPNASQKCYKILLVTSEDTINLLIMFACEGISQISFSKHNSSHLDNLVFNASSNNTRASMAILSVIR